MRREDEVRIAHILDTAEAVRGFIAGRRREDLERDRLLSFAIQRAVEIVGEAASRISPEARDSMPGVPWAAIVAMRNRLIHAYFDVDLDILWKTAAEELPELTSVLRAGFGA